MNVEDLIAQKLIAHPVLTAISFSLLVLSIVATKILAPRIPVPAPDAPVVLRVLHFVFINWPAWGAVLAGEVKSLIPGIPLPFASYVARVQIDPVDKAREVLKEKNDAGAIDAGILLCLGVVGLVVALVMAGGGCSYDKGYVRALQIKGELSEGATIAHAGWHTFDSFYHDNIVSEAPSYDVGVTRLRAWQSGGEKRANTALKTWRDALKAYREALAAAGAAQRSDWTALIIKTMSAAAEAIAVLADVGVSVDWSLPLVPEIPGLPTAAVPQVPSLALMPMSTLWSPPSTPAYLRRRRSAVFLVCANPFMPQELRTSACSGGAL